MQSSGPFLLYDGPVPRRREQTSVAPASPSPVSLGAIVFAVAAVVRLFAAWQLGDLPISRTPQLDSTEYLNWARAIAAGSAAWPPYPAHAPGYPFFLGGLLALFDASLMAVRICQALLGAISCVLTARIAARTVSRAAFLPAGLLQAAYGPLIYLDTALLAESLFMFLLVLSLDIVTTAERNWKRWLLVGAAVGAASIVRPTALVLIPAYAIVMAGRLNWQPRAWPLVGALTAGVLIFVAPVVIQNWRVSGVPMIQAYGGMNVYLGNRPSGDGAARARPGGEWDRPEGDASREGASQAEQDRYYVQRALDEISRQPGAYLRLLGSKLLRAFEDEEVRDTHSYYFFTDAMPVLRWLPSFGWIVALAAAGLLASSRDGLSYVAAYFVAMLLTVVFLVIGTRYRMPIVPPLIVLAGGAIAALFERARTRQWKRFAVVTVAAIVVFAASEWRSDPASRNLSEEWSFTGLSLLQERRLDDAERAYRQAIALDESSFAWDGLGLVLQRRELRDEARDAFVHALRINPDNATAWLHLGLAYEFLRDPRAAIDAYQNALKITPMRTEAQEMLSGALSRYRAPR